MKNSRTFLRSAICAALLMPLACGKARPIALHDGSTSPSEVSLGTGGGMVGTGGLVLAGDGGVGGGRFDPDSSVAGAGGAMGTGGATVGTGVTWLPANQGASVLGGSLIAIDSKLYMQHANAIWLSSDGGTTWTPTGPPVPDAYAGGFLAIIGPHYFLPAGTDGVVRSSPDGSQWTPLHSGFPADITVGYLVRVGGTLFAGTNQGVYASTDNGDHWTANNSGPMETTIIPRIIAVDTTLFLATNRGDSFRGTPSDSGYAWMELFDMRVPYSIQRKGNTLFSASLAILTSGQKGNQSPRVNRSEDDGVTWSPCEAGILPGVTRLLEVLGSDLYAGVAFSGADATFIVYRSLDDGGSWNQAMEGLPDGVFINSWAVSGGYLVAATNAHGMWRIARASRASP